MLKEDRLKLAEFLLAHGAIVYCHVPGVLFDQTEQGLYTLEIQETVNEVTKTRTYAINGDGQYGKFEDGQCGKFKDACDFPTAFLDAYLHRLATRVYNVLVQDIGKVDPIVRKSEV